MNNYLTLCIFIIQALFVTTELAYSQDGEGEKAQKVISDLVYGIESGNAKEDLVFLVGRDHAEGVIRSLRELHGRVHEGDAADLQALVESYSRAQREGLTQSNAHRLQKSMDALSKSAGLYTSPAAFLAKYPFSLLLSQVFTRAVDFTYSQWDRLERFALRDRDIAEALLGYQRRSSYRSLLNRSGTDTIQYDFLAGGSTRPLVSVCTGRLPKIGIDIVNTRMRGNFVLVTSQAFDAQDVERVAITLFEEDAPGQLGRVVFMQMEDGRFIDSSRDQIAAYSISNEELASIESRQLIARVNIEWSRDWTSRLRDGRAPTSGCVEQLRFQ